jgi:hypothetical protein
MLIKTLMELNKKCKIKTRFSVKRLKLKKKYLKRFKKLINK